MSLVHVVKPDALADETRATYLSIQSFCGRLLFATTLFLSSLAATTGSKLNYADNQAILIGYALAGLVLFAVLAATARRAQLEPRTRERPT